MKRFKQILFDISNKSGLETKQASVRRRRRRLIDRLVCRHHRSYTVTMRRLHLYCLVHIVITVKTSQYKPVQIFFWDSVHFFLIEMHSCGLQCKIHIFAGNIVEHVQFTLQCSDVRGADGILVGTWRLAFCQNETKRSSSSSLSSSSSYSFCNLGQR